MNPNRRTKHPECTLATLFGHRSSCGWPICCSRSSLHQKTSSAQGHRTRRLVVASQTSYTGISPATLQPLRPPTRVAAHMHGRLKRNPVVPGLADNPSSQRLVKSAVFEHRLHRTIAHRHGAWLAACATLPPSPPSPPTPLSLAWVAAQAAAHPKDDNLADIPRIHSLVEARPVEHELRARHKVTWSPPWHPLT